MTYPFFEAFEDAKAHARRQFPEESCGVIVKGKYIACDNVADDPANHIDHADCDCRLCAFAIGSKEYDKHAIAGIDMVIHSHPNGPFYPSLADMEYQARTGRPWAIIVLDEERISTKPTIWGAETEIPAILGREFMHGVTDCYQLIKDVYALGREKLEAQGIVGWPFEPITLMHKPREDAWWEGDADLYEENFAAAGFVEVTDAPKPGDVFLMKIRSSKNNHGGVLLDNALILHHLPQRLSRREPAGIWGRQATKWLRYVGEGTHA
jgi:proteasome lid subunit RPN8/RPN11